MHEPQQGLSIMSHRNLPTAGAAISRGSGEVLLTLEEKSEPQQNKADQGSKHNKKRCTWRLRFQAIETLPGNRSFAEAGGPFSSSLSERVVSGRRRT